MEKFFIRPTFFHRLLALPLLILSLLLFATLPGRIFADTTNPWELTIRFSDKNSQTILLPLDYTLGGIEYTLDEPYIPLRLLAEACNLEPDVGRFGENLAVLWPDSQNPVIFVVGLPLSIHIYNEEKGDFAVYADQQFQEPRLLDSSVCVPLSFLDILGLNYEINAHTQSVTILAENLASLDSTGLCQAAVDKFAAGLPCWRHLLSCATATAKDNSLTAAQEMLLLASHLHAVVIEPGEEFSFNSRAGGLSASPTAKEVRQAIACVANQAKLPLSLANSDTVWQNNTDFPLQLACHTDGQNFTVRLYQLNSQAAAFDYLGQIAP